MADRCAHCQTRSVRGDTDLLGRVTLVCDGCGWREPVVRRSTPVPVDDVTISPDERRRRRVCTALQEHGPLTIGGIMRHAVLTSSMARRTIDQLLQTSTIIAYPPMRLGPSGRPGVRYGLVICMKEVRHVA